MPAREVRSRLGAMQEPAAAQALPAGLLRLRRDWGAASLAARAVRRGFLSRAGRLYAWGAALSSGALLSWASTGGEDSALVSVLPLSVTGMSWAAGLVACAAARDVVGEERAMGLDGLWALRGVSPPEQARARMLATIRVVTGALAWPALALTLFAMVLSFSPAAATALVPWALGVAAYAIVFGCALGVLARWSSWLFGQHGRAVFLALTLGPHLLRGVFEDVPSIVSFFARLLHHVSSLGHLA